MKAFKQLAVQVHPDKNPHERELATKAFRLIMEVPRTLGVIRRVGA